MQLALAAFSIFSCFSSVAAIGVQLMKPSLMLNTSSINHAAENSTGKVTLKFSVQPRKTLKFRVPEKKSSVPQTNLTPVMTGVVGRNSSQGSKLALKFPPAQSRSQAALTAKVHFLFLAVDKVSNLGVWRSFFMHAPLELYRAFVHCKLPSCAAQVYGSPLQLVPTVPSYYCTDLVSPMNQLLNFALKADEHHSHPNDRFAFISDSSLPAKPFLTVHSTLTNRPGSDFCVFPSKEWADIQDPSYGHRQIVPKHHQWIVLNRAHAQKSSMLWARGQMHDLMSRFRMNTMRWTYANNSFGDSRNFGCLDEFWHLAALYGPLQMANANTLSDVALPLFSGGPLHIGGNEGWQGTCDTFVIWSKYIGSAGGIANSFQKLHQSLDTASTPHGGNAQRPGWWDKVSTQGIRAIRASDFLFVRKFVDKPWLTDGGDFEVAWTREVLA